MPTRVTARIPVTPGVHSDLKRVKEDGGADDFDALMRDMLAVYEAEENEESNA